jgi:hypothetical protein
MWWVSYPVPIRITILEIPLVNLTLGDLVSSLLLYLSILCYC